jgi:hypothetical protein
MEIPEKEVLKMENVCTSLVVGFRGHASKFLTDNNFFDWHEDSALEQGLRGSTRGSL